MHKLSLNAFTHLSLITMEKKTGSLFITLTAFRQAVYSYDMPGVWKQDMFRQNNNINGDDRDFKGN